jgi:hypothetical protein
VTQGVGEGVGRAVDAVGLSAMGQASSWVERTEGLVTFSIVGVLWLGLGFKSPTKFSIRLIYPTRRH